MRTRGIRLARTVLLGTLLVTAPPLARAQPPEVPTTIHGSVGRMFELSEQQFVAVAEAMPEEKYGFVPTAGAFDGVRSFAEQVRHVACANIGFFNEIEGRTPPDGCEHGEPKDVRTKPELVRYLKESFAYGNRVLTSVDARSALERAEGRYAGPNTKLGLATAAVWHLADHYGQLVVYLRLNGIVPPPKVQNGLTVR